MSYPIGKSGVPWGDEEKQQWTARQEIKRSYNDLVVAKIKQLAAYQGDIVDLIQYGALPYDETRYPLYLFRSKNWQETKPTFLVTGGVHGYETSGVMGALLFVETRLSEYADDFNFIVAPCLSPWGFETINRWNPMAIDPNRSFYQDSPAPESALLMQYIEQQQIKPWCHIDLHETTDTDNTDFRPALAARDAIEQKTWNIPDGFYGVGDTLRPNPEFQKAIVESVAQVTHIAPADAHNQLIGEDLQQFGVINYACKALGLCAGLSSAEYVSTTEVYPDSPKVDDQNCNLAQVAAITGAIGYLQQEQKLKNLLKVIDTQPEAVTFKEVISVIDSCYEFTPTAFRNGEVENAAGDNNGSCKILAFGQIHQLTESQTLHCFGLYYREEVLNEPDGASHGNIRNFMKTGWQGVHFDAIALKRG